MLTFGMIPLLLQKVKQWQSTVDFMRRMKNNVLFWLLFCYTRRLATIFCSKVGSWQIKNIKVLASPFEPFAGIQNQEIFNCNAAALVSVVPPNTQ